MVHIFPTKDDTLSRNGLFIGLCERLFESRDSEQGRQKVCFNFKLGMLENAQTILLRLKNRFRKFTMTQLLGKTRIE